MPYQYIEDSLYLNHNFKQSSSVLQYPECTFKAIKQRLTTLKSERLTRLALL